MAGHVFLETINLTKRFGEILAVDSVSLRVNTGEIRGLIGENGSGKSTVSSMISATHTVTSGEMLANGQPYRPKTSRDARNAGIAMVVQEMGTISELTVAENIFLGEETRFKKNGFINRKAMNSAAQKALADIGATDMDVSKPARAFNFETRKLVEIAKAIYFDPTLLIVDETTTALSHSGREILYKLIADFKQKGKAVLFISHDLPELMQTCDCLTVLRDGKLVAHIAKDEFDESQIKQAMVGRKIEGDYYRSDFDSTYGSRVALRASLSVNGLDSFEIILHDGEILGVCGLSDCGMHQLGRALFGLDKGKSGTVTFFGADTGIEKTIGSIESALDAGIGYISKDRDTEALILPASIKENLVLSALHKMGRVISPKKERDFASRQIDHLSIRCSSMNQPVAELSGGNKQKVSFSKWIGNGSRVLIMDSPTRGVDVGAKTTMYQLICRLKGEGYAILLISEELPELIGMCDSVAVMKDGKITARFPRSQDLSESKIIEHMI
ncbi:MAG: sugar ABC transporter ATP-binding protein [Clostridiales bacterium]|jgi:ribose transport system ATP-binding protein|nr:sugar ABC transporter ATP-binding protein [Clostridiales bacterium]